MNLAVLVSGSGTLLAAMIERGVPITLVLADKPCRGLEIATEAGIPTRLLRRSFFGYRPGIVEGWDREGFTKEVDAVLKSHDIDVVAMAGFFTILHPAIFESYGHRILNIHPALLPAFPGEFAVRDTLAAGVTETGSTVHIATTILDDATYIVRQVKGVPVMRGDTVESLWERIKQEERPLYAEVLLDILNGTIDLDALVRAVDSA